MSLNESRGVTGRLELSVDLSLFSETAVKNACYRLADLVTSELQRGPANQLCVTLILGDSGVGADAVEAAFRRELLDQDLREKVARETEALRNLILAHALSRVPLLHTEEETADYE
ncbi:MAG: His-Xaa-Ser system protein HxsD [Acidobacteria bacterium]|nr:His-Xaa-Ser system protein HxsD [Acidobacteriota bacterium]